MLLSPCAEKSEFINAAKLVLAGSLEAFEVEAKSIFPKAPEDSVIVFSNLNLKGRGQQKY